MFQGGENTKPSNKHFHRAASCLSFCLFNQHISVNAYYDSGTALGTGETSVNKKAKSLPLWELCSKNKQDYTNRDKWHE